MGFNSGFKGLNIAALWSTQTVTMSPHHIQYWAPSSTASELG